MKVFSAIFNAMVDTLAAVVMFFIQTGCSISGHKPSESGETCTNCFKLLR